MTYLNILLYSYYTAVIYTQICIKHYVTFEQFGVKLFTNMRLFDAELRILRFYDLKMKFPQKYICQNSINLLL